MRDYINIIESTNCVADLYEAAPGNYYLDGSLDANGLLGLLPQVTDRQKFLDGIEKLRTGHVGEITPDEKLEFALAWISLLGVTQPVRQQVIGKLIALKELPLTSNTTGTTNSATQAHSNGTGTTGTTAGTGTST